MASGPERGLDIPTRILSLVGPTVGATVVFAVGAAVGSALGGAVGAAVGTGVVHDAATSPAPVKAAPRRKSARVRDFLLSISSSFLFLGSGTRVRPSLSTFSSLCYLRVPISGSELWHSHFFLLIP